MNDVAKMLNLLGVSVEEFAERSGCRLSLDQSKQLATAAVIEPVTMWTTNKQPPRGSDS
jgi:hypothetical protein